MENILQIILTTFLISTLLNVVLKKFDIPTVIGYIISGTIISQIFSIGDNSGNDSLHQLAEFGIVFLMFTIGLEFSIRHLKAMKREVFLFGTLQIMVTGNLIGAFMHEIAGMDLKSAIITGFSLSLSSTAIVLKMLTEKNQIHSGFGRVVVGILLSQDIAIIPILLMLTLFVSPGESIESMLVKTFIGMAILLLIIFFAGKYILENFLKWTLSSESEEIFLVAALMVVIGASFLAHSLGFSYSLGAFLAGMTLSETRFKYRIEADLLVFRDIFLGIFFVSIGIQIDPETLMKHWMTLPLFIVGIMLFKAILLYLLLSRFTMKRTALKSSLALMEVGEFALAIFAMAAQEGLLSRDTAQLLILTVVFSMILTPFIINNLKRLTDIFLSKEPETDIVMVSTGYENHVLICGYGPVSRKVAHQLKRLSIPYLILEHDHKLVMEAKKENEPIILANAAAHSVLKSVNADRAMAIVVAIENPSKTRMVVDAVTTIAPDANTVVAVINKSHEKIIETFSVNAIINASELLSQKIMEELLKCHLKNEISDRGQR
jgi:CPA2 family monovalent cation:H+ antiporter-2